MVILYFSGTGNSKYIAELFSRSMNETYSSSKCHSIEENIDFGTLISSEEVIGFCYPVYSSRVPRIMREFAGKYMDFLQNKKILIFCTQMLFSGDGARAFTDMFPKNYFKVIYAEHFLMPNNVCNVFITPLASERKIKNYSTQAEKKMQLVCRNISSGIIKKRGFNPVSQVLGLPQGILMPLIEKITRSSVRIHKSCTAPLDGTQCRLCVSICPMKNLDFQDGKIVHTSNCIVCYRCINRCPEKAITVFIHTRVKKQYTGL